MISAVLGLALGLAALSMLPRLAAHRTFPTGNMVYCTALVVGLVAISAFMLVDEARSAESTTGAGVFLTIVALILLVWGLANMDHEEREERATVAVPTVVMSVLGLLLFPFLW